MKNFAICLFMLLLVALGKYNGARLVVGPAPQLAQYAAAPATASAKYSSWRAAAAPAPLVTALVTP